MRASLVLAVLAISCLVGYVAADQFAVLVAGSNGYDNYRHQADVCHAYQILIERGVKASNIITFFFDDIANNTYNPFKFQLFNRPTPKGVPGKDVYTGCRGDYTGVLNNQDMFLAAITANVSGVPAGYPVLKSGPKDHVFINFVDHGSPGAIYFMDKNYNFVPMYNWRFLNALKTMSDKMMFSKLVIYLEACEAGSMFTGLLPNNTEIYAETASSPDESSWGTYCPGEKVGNLTADSVDGKELESCLGDLYSVNWMERVDARGVHESLEDQYREVRNKTDLSHVMQYGDLSYLDRPVGQFIGDLAGKKLSPFVTLKNAADIDMTVAMNSAWNSRDIALKRAQHVYNKRVSEDRYSQAARDALAKLNDIVTARKLADDVFNAFINQVTAINQRITTQSLLASPKLPITQDQCVVDLDQAYMSMVGYTQYSIQYARVFINACRQHKNTAQLINALQTTRPIATAAY